MNESDARILLYEVLLKDTKKLRTYIANNLCVANYNDNLLSRNCFSVLG